MRIVQQQKKNSYRNFTQLSIQRDLVNATSISFITVFLSRIILNILLMHYNINVRARSNLIRQRYAYMIKTKDILRQ